ncbi:phosphate ABC transporter permease [Prochlorococcus sp. MIT 1223]|uniref:phosphate ABC transporter permease n=1 Tax=Prochlorococcus sp. MIT 1223 TaxID=3096217 RepID=UPI002A75769F|nr:phosphate ABC transporter permease [Prochlorococcus sp. MIT 1223]
MYRLNLTPVAIVILPALAIIPVAIEVSSTAHIGGLNTLLSFFSAAINPSIEPIVLSNAWNSLQITIAIALIGWISSVVFGTILGVLSSNIFWQVFTGRPWIGNSIRLILAIPRSIHEVIWGLLLLQILGLNPLVAIIAIMIPHSSLMSRVIANQLDTLNKKSLIAITQSGSGPFAALATSLLPPMRHMFTTYAGYRLECALRGATLLGLFGLGGIGTELQLTIQSLEFRELWTSLWMLAISMYCIEKIIIAINRANSSIQNPRDNGFRNSIFIGLTTIIIISSIKSIQIDPLNTIQLDNLIFPAFLDIKSAFEQLPILSLIYSTIYLTLLSAGIAIGSPPLLMMLCQSKLSMRILTFVWLFFRLIPPPLSALLLLLTTTPSISIAALALGISNIGVMGRLLKENLSHDNNLLFNSIKSLGGSSLIAWLYGKLSPQSKSYLAFASYRTDVLLRETAVVGVVGGVGLGWQLQESLSSFDWAQVIVITTTFSLLTLSGELISDKAREYWIKKTTDPSLCVSLQS